MKNIPAKPRARFVAKDLFRAFAAGLVVGLVVWWLAQSRPGSTNTLVSAIVFVAAASVSVVCYGLGASGSRASPKTRAHEVPAWLCAIGGGVVLSLHTMNFLALAI
jgi:hypothetical protein